MVELTIDGRRIEAENNETILEAALRNGIHIPHLCYFKGLSVAGNCRLCLVKVNELAKLQPSCNTPVANNMKVVTDNPEVREARRAVLQLITLNHPVDCGICDKAGECQLQDAHFEYGGQSSMSVEPKHHKPKFYDLNERIVLDSERCVLCSRCVRFANEISGTAQLGIVQRGSRARVERLDDRPYDDPYSENVVDICPVGAMLSRKFLYQSRVWFLQKSRSVCPGCERGCSIFIWHRKPQWRVQALNPEVNTRIFRVTPCEDPRINGSWICDKPRDLERLFARPRLAAARLDGKTVPADQAAALARKWIRDARRPAAVVSAWGSNEELTAFRDRLAGWFSRIFVKDDCLAQPGEVVADNLLIRPDKNPNKRKVRELFGDAYYAGSPEFDLLLVWGEGLPAESAPAGCPVVRLSSYEAPSTRTPDLAIPISTMLERAGTYTNFAGVENRFFPVGAKEAGVFHAEDLFRVLGP